MNLEEWRQIGADLYHRLHLPTYPVAIKFIRDPSEIPANTVRPQNSGQKWSLCQAFTYTRRWGWTTAMTAEDNFCVPGSAMHLWVNVSEEDFVESQMRQGWHKDRAAEQIRYQFAMKAFAGDKAEKARQYMGFVSSPLPDTQVAPDTVLVFGDGTHITHIIHMLCYDYKRPVTSAFEGFGESCVKGGLLPFLTGRPQIVIPGMGDRVFAGISDHEIGIGIPGNMLAGVMPYLFKTGGKMNMGLPVKSFLPTGLTESITPGFQYLKDKLDLDKTS